MPIIAIHGVNVREPDWAIKRNVVTNLARFVAPVIQRGASCTITPVYWGDLGVTFKWNHRSLPGDELRQMMVQMFATSRQETFDIAGEFRASSGTKADPVLTFLTEPGLSTESGITTFGLEQPPIERRPPYSVGSISEAALLARFETALASRAGARPVDDAYPATAEALRSSVHGLYAPTSSTQSFSYQEVELHASLMLKQQDRSTSWLVDIADAIIAAIELAKHRDAEDVAKALVRYRQPVNDLITTFFGDVFVYLATRGLPGAPGPILKAFLVALRAAADEKSQTGEPIVVLSHSQGGQIVYEALSSIIGKEPGYSDIKVDVWCAAACQVGLFEEMKLFWSSQPQYSASAGNKAPAPGRDVLGTWIACWDPTDIISYTTAPILEPVLDVSFESGWVPPLSHGGYLALPEFYVRLRNTILNPTLAGWNAPVGVH